MNVMEVNSSHNSDLSLCARVKVLAPPQRRAQSSKEGLIHEKKMEGIRTT